MEATHYSVAVTHRCPEYQGEFRVTVYRRNSVFFCNADRFGCSREYRVRCAEDALRAFFAEHGCSVVRANQVRE